MENYDKIARLLGTNNVPHKSVCENAVAHQIVEEALEVLSGCGPELSSYKTNSGNKHLQDVYFTCDKNEINEAVLRARECLHIVEKKRFKQQEHQGHIGRSPERDLDSH